MGCFARKTGKFIRAMLENTTPRRGRLPNPVTLIPQPLFAKIMTDPQQPSTQRGGDPTGQPIYVNPVQAIAPIPDTSSQALGLEGEGDKSLETSASGLRRVVEKTVDKLGRSRSLSSKSPSKRIFSLGRNRGKEPGPSGTIPIHIYPYPLVLISKQL